MFRCEKCLNEYTKHFDSCPMCGGRVVGFQKPLDPVEVEEIARSQQIQKEKERANSVMKEELDRVVEQALSGKKIFLYQSLYMSVDSELDSDNKKITLNPYDDTQVRQAGLFGWKIVGVVPRTSGNALMNYEGFGKAWAGGIGGNVVGAYVMMEYELTKENVNTSIEVIKDSIKRAYKIS